MCKFEQCKNHYVLHVRFWRIASAENLQPDREKVGAARGGPQAQSRGRRLRGQAEHRRVLRAVAQGGARKAHLIGVRVSKIGKISKILQIFGGLVLGCIKTKFCKKICVWQHFSSSTRFASFCTAAISKFSQKIGWKKTAILAVILRWPWYYVFSYSDIRSFKSCSIQQSTSPLEALDVYY